MRIHFSLSLSRNFYLLSKHGLFLFLEQIRNGETVTLDALLFLEHPIHPSIHRGDALEDEW